MSYTAEVNLICSYCGYNYTIKKEFADRSRGYFLVRIHCEI